MSRPAVAPALGVSRQRLPTGRRRPAVRPEDGGALTQRHRQVRDAPVVLYSHTTSRQDLIPKGRKTDFIFYPNRLNVAISRAQCLTFLIGTEELIDTRATSIDEMKDLNHFCRYISEAQIPSTEDESIFMKEAEKIINY